MTTDHRLGARAKAQLTPSPERTLFWGDLHNHNAVGYAKGSLDRSIELAREHLDFFAFTGHASWHDMPRMPGDRHMKWVRGFDVHRAHWPRTRQLIREANGDEFVALLGYEWHSSQFGDYCVIFPDDDGELFLPDNAAALQQFARDQGAWAIPHHVAYKQGWRGANWQHVQHETAPVVEIFSEHGCTLTDRSPFPMIRHSNGGRSTANTIARQLQQGRRFGFVASSDDHRGYPGAHGEGVLGIWAEALTREALFEAVQARRTYAVTGDRILLEVTLNGQPMGADAPLAAEREIDVRVVGQDAIESVELIRNGRVIRRHFPEDHFDDPVQLPGRAKCRLQYGWGPWSDLNLGRICDWQMSLRLDGGRFLRALPCFQAAPFDEDRRDRLQFVSESELRLESATTRVESLGEDPTKSLVFEVEGPPEATLAVQLNRPAEQSLTARLGDLVEDNRVEFTGEFTSESFIVHRLLGPSEYSTALRWQDDRDNPAAGDWYYVRVRQHNGHLAWSSPIWVG